MNIIIDYEKCQTPEPCGRCFQVCEPQVFALHPTEEDVVENEKWMVEPVWISFCTQCNKCVKECPEGAITILP
ncbi:MAG: 4Fe-4S dicluster domain-containing protein [Candidatus Methanofastidiosia archaeon]|jgi:NAD-dependent dihydropyrimidine dehydrogenase PreA subunit